MAVNPLLVLVLPVVYIVASTFVLLKFSVFLTLLGQAAVKVRQVPQLGPIEPVVVNIVDFFTRVYGPLHKFTPQVTHVLLVAIIVALVVNGQRRK